MFAPTYDSIKLRLKPKIFILKKGKHFNTSNNHKITAYAKRDGKFWRADRYAEKAL